MGFFLVFVGPFEKSLCRYNILRWLLWAFYVNMFLQNSFKCCVNFWKSKIFFSRIEAIHIQKRINIICLRLIIQHLSTRMIKGSYLQLRIHLWYRLFGHNKVLQILFIDDTKFYTRQWNKFCISSRNWSAVNVLERLAMICYHVTNVGTLHFLFKLDQVNN